MKPRNLTDITHWSHVALSGILRSGDLTVDLTVGNGKDTLFLWRAVGPGGCVVGFDIQEKAVQSAKVLLKNAGAEVRSYTTAPVNGIATHGVSLILADHAGWTDFVKRPPRAVIANLGYLPGSDSPIATQIPSTIQALAAALEKLEVGGRLAVVCYVEHPGGREEAEAVEELITGEAGSRFRVLRVDNPMTPTAPFLLVVEKSRES